MNIHWFTLIMQTLLWCLIYSCNGAHTEEVTKVTESTTNVNSKKYCGRYLTEALATLCQGNYQTLRPVRIHKKNYWQSQFYSDMPVQQYRPEYPFQSKQEATSMLGNYGRKRRRRGVYNECCEKSCSKDQLLMYCAAPSSTTSRSR